MISSNTIARAPFLRLVYFLLLSLVWPVFHARGDDQDPATQAAIEKFNSIADREARSFRVSFAGGGMAFELAPQPLLVWTNPVSGSIRGRVYLWTHQRIPALVGSVYKYDEQLHVSSELHALARQPITGKGGSGESWDVRSASVEFNSVPNTPPSGTSRSIRLAQMRDVARRFTASRTDPDKTSWDLRLLSQPLYRYPEGPNTPDGALFVFVQGTNPDVILLIEASDTDGKSTWKYGLARMHRYELNVLLDGNRVQQFRALSSQEVVDKKQPYTVFRTQLSGG